MFLTALTTWIRGFLALAILVGAALLIREWVEELPRFAVVAGQATPQARTLSFGERVVAWSRDPDASTAPLVGAGLLLLLAFGGRALTPRVWKRQEPVPIVIPDRTERLETWNGRALHVVTFGRDDAPPVVLVHGLGSDHTQWYEAIQDLSGTHRVIAYDLFGHGRSVHRRDGDHSLEAMARDLDGVLDWAGDRKATVVGHSMGGMIALTWCRGNEAKAHDRLAGLVLAHTSARNPFEAMAPVPLHRNLQDSLHVPLLRASRAVAPLVRLMNKLAYWNGSIHWENEFSQFAGRETREQLDRSARIAAGLDPATQASCAIALTRHDTVGTLSSIDVPTLVVAGDRDGVIVPDAGREIARLIPGAHLLVLEPARHMGFMEQRDAFADGVHKAARTHAEERVAGKAGPTPSRESGKRRSKRGSRAGARADGPAGRRANGQRPSSTRRRPGPSPARPKP